MFLLLLFLLPLPQTRGHVRHGAGGKPREVSRLGIGRGVAARVAPRAFVHPRLQLQLRVVPRAQRSPQVGTACGPQGLCGCGCRGPALAPAQARPHRHGAPWSCNALATRDTAPARARTASRRAAHLQRARPRQQHQRQRPGGRGAGRLGSAPPVLHGGGHATHRQHPRTPGQSSTSHASSPGVRPPPRRRTTRPRHPCDSSQSGSSWKLAVLGRYGLTVTR